ncbi:MAG: N-acetylmuramoyl-L-alanine amidase [candidate division WOR-3 bacterium]
MKRLVVFILTTGLVNAAYKICLDPGHGGSDPGSTGSYFTEKEANLHVANWAKHFMLMNSNISQVLMTRTGDWDVSLQDRVNYANSNNVDRFISVHQNAYNGSAQGTETYCYTYGSSNSFNMRDSTHRYLVRAYSYTDRGVKTANYYVLVYTNMPSILGEGSFIDYNGSYNESWRYAYDWRGHRLKQGLAYAQGLCAHLNISKPSFTLLSDFPETTITAGVTFQVKDSFYIASYHQICDLVLEVKRVSDGAVLYQNRVSNLSSGYGTRVFNVSLPLTGQNYQVYFLSYLVPQGGNWDNRITYFSTSLLPITVVSQAFDTSYVIFKSYPLEVQAGENFTIVDSFYIAPTQSPADLVFEIKNRSTGNVMYQERVSNIGSGYWIKTFGLNPTIALPDSGYDYRVYFLSVLCPPGGSWSNRYTYASTYSNPTWVRTNPTQDTPWVSFQFFPEELQANQYIVVTTSSHLPSNILPCEQVLEVVNSGNDSVLNSIRREFNSSGDYVVNWGENQELLAPELGFDYYLYFRTYLTPPGAGLNEAIVIKTTVPVYTAVRSPINESSLEFCVRGDGKGVFGLLEIELSGGPFVLEIFDVSGRLVLRSKDDAPVSKREIVLSGDLFPSKGVYFCFLKSGKVMRKGKIIVK